MHLSAAFPEWFKPDLHDNAERSEWSDTLVYFALALFGKRG